MSYIRENKKMLHEKFQALADGLMGVVPNYWRKVVVGYFLAREKGVSHLQLHVAVGDDYLDIMKASWDTDVYDEAIIEIQQVCQELRAVCVRAGDKWNAMTFCLWPNGTFNTDFDYDVITDYDSTFILDWQSQYLSG